MMSSYVDRELNLLAAFGLLVADRVVEATSTTAGHLGTGAAGLATVTQFPGCSIEELRRALGVTHSAGVRLVDRLVADGLAERHPGRDGRSTAIAPTPVGMERTTSILAARQQAIGDMFSVLTGAERTQLAGLAEKVLAQATVSVERGDQICRLCDIAACPQERCPVELEQRRHATNGGTR